MISKISAIVGGVGGLILAFVIFQLMNTLWLLPAARNEGRDLYIAEQAAADRKAEMERKGDDATLRSKSDYELCADGLRSRRLPIDACEQLRGLHPE